MAVPVVAAASIDQRFAQLIQQFGLTKNSFAISLGKTASVVQHLIDGRNKPGFDLMCKVFEVYPNVSRDWLLLGRGPMLVGSNGGTVPPISMPEQATAEPDFEPIDLADVAPRAVRRPTGNRLQPEEIAATLALATATANGTATVNAAVPVAASNASVAANESVHTESSPVLPPVADLPQSTTTGIGFASPVAASQQRPTRPFRPTSASNSNQANEAVAPRAAPESESAPVTASPAASAPIMPPAAPMLNAEAYVAAAIHAQHLQHQLALAELRNQHLLEQQQMLREMLAMARQSMV